MAIRQSAIVGLCLALVLAVAVAWPPPRADSAPIALPTAIYFPATGQAVRGEFLGFWADNGQARIFGLPITGAVLEDGRLVQYFERARFELTMTALSSATMIGTVQLGLVGREAASAAPLTAMAPAEPGLLGPERRYFDGTGHSLAFAFKRFWEANGGLPIFGAPISEEFDEGGRTVQYFERARFEYVPEFAGAPEEVALGSVGRAAAMRRGLAFVPGAQPVEAVEWSEALNQTLLDRQRQARQEAALVVVAQPVEPFDVAVSLPVVNTFRAPSTAAEDAGVIYNRHIYRIDGIATGEPVDGDGRWYRLALDGSYVPAAHVAAFTPPPPPRTWAGRWVDVNLTTFTLTVYDGARPLRSALVIAGRKSRTPTGIFAIQRRVRSETMDSATVGIPKGHPEYYYLKNVEYTQYFTGAGHAIHGNYWVHPSRWGQFLSNGCIGLRTHDAAWVWSLTSVGNPVYIHF